MTPNRGRQLHSRSVAEDSAEYLETKAENVRAQIRFRKILSFTISSVGFKLYVSISACARLNYSMWEQSAAERDKAYPGVSKWTSIQPASLLIVCKANHPSIKISKRLPYEHLMMFMRVLLLEEHLHPRRLWVWQGISSICDVWRETKFTLSELHHTFLNINYNF